MSCVTFRPPLGLYVHVPFCPYRCHYCDFAVVLGRRESVSAYAEALMRDIRAFARQIQGRKIRSVYFGGGTPSLLEPELFEKILDGVSGCFALEKNSEISLEANPETLTLEKLSGYLKAGINRLSLGVQTLQNRHLRRMGRFPDGRRCAAAFRLIRKAGFQNVNVDILFGLPEQTLSEWNKTLEKILEWRPEHLSAYGLQVEPGTRFWRDQKRGNLPLPLEETHAEMYEILLKVCRENGLRQYEISNFAKPGFQCRHNLIYWKNEEYLGAGLGAVSSMKGNRFWFTRNFKNYLSGEKLIGGSETLSRSAQMGETLMLGLRLRSGVSSEEFLGRFGVLPESRYADAVRRFRGLGLLESGAGRLALTEKGLLLSNEVLQSFV